MKKNKLLENYGITVYCLTFAALFSYLIWAFASEQMLDFLGIAYYPSKEWAIAIPSWICMTVLFLYVMLTGHNFYLAPSLDSYNIITESSAAVASETMLLKNFEAYDVPISKVQKVLYSRLSRAGTM